VTVLLELALLGSLMALAFAGGFSAGIWWVLKSEDE
jgi:hypothetical protein